MKVDLIISRSTTLLVRSLVSNNILFCFQDAQGHRAEFEEKTQLKNQKHIVKY